jgi:hypothetical protein
MLRVAVPLLAIIIYVLYENKQNRSKTIKELLQIQAEYRKCKSQPNEYMVLKLLERCDRLTGLKGDLLEKKKKLISRIESIPVLPK